MKIHDENRFIIITNNYKVHMGKDDGILAALAIGAVILGLAGIFSRPKCPACKTTLNGKPRICPNCRTPLTWRN